MNKSKSKDNRGGIYMHGRATVRHPYKAADVFSVLQAQHPQPYHQPQSRFFGRIHRFVEDIFKRYCRQCQSSQSRTHLVFVSAFWKEGQTCAHCKHVLEERRT